MNDDRDTAELIGKTAPDPDPVEITDPQDSNFVEPFEGATPVDEDES